MYQHIDEKKKEIDLASKGLNADGSANPTKTVFYSAGALNGSLMNAMTDAEGVTLLFTYQYAGYEFCSAITPEIARQIFREDIPWYGPCYIAMYCPTVMVGPAM